MTRSGVEDYAKEHGLKLPNPQKKIVKQQVLLLSNHQQRAVLALKKGDTLTDVISKGKERTSCIANSRFLMKQKKTNNNNNNANSETQIPKKQNKIQLKSLFKMQTII